MPQIRIGNKTIGLEHPTYFIAEIGSNHNGSINLALELIELAKEAGVDAVKFQHYRADSLASRAGFAGLHSLAHYSDNPYKVFKKYEMPWQWTPTLKEYCDHLDIEFISTPYDLEAVDHLNPYVNVFKIGSGDITYKTLIQKVKQTGKPIILSTGASTGMDVSIAIYNAIADSNYPLCVMQCNTNYDNRDDTYVHYNLSVLSKYATTFPWAVLGFSDHGWHVEPTLAAVALGARIIERHFTKDLDADTPDSPFATTMSEFQSLITAVRTVEASLGDGVKKVEANEQETVILQRRAIRAVRLLPARSHLNLADVQFLRPAPIDCAQPYLIDYMLGKRLVRDIPEGDYLREDDVEHI